MWPEDHFREKTVSNKQYWENWKSTCLERQDWDPNHTHQLKINSKYTKDLNIKPVTLSNTEKCWIYWENSWTWQQKHGYKLNNRHSDYTKGGKV